MTATTHSHGHPTSTPLGEKYHDMFWETRENYPVRPELILVGCIPEN